ncbi:hypothetical protein PROFUN_00468 [Planoprotostelium fungivorum]|uniref:Uncharacterized protein n=1 Tax=Planoprotostelium fungivorum TaxID=1890364 RepID=A0A2P6N0W7_9EUKA|nr:hypothetical protein PROFUN_00468 [Planoprotostelium fungivorum]
MGSASVWEVLLICFVLSVSSERVIEWTLSDQNYTSVQWSFSEPTMLNVTLLDGQYTNLPMNFSSTNITRLAKYSLPIFVGARIR